MPSARTTAAARTALQALNALRLVTGDAPGVRSLNAAIDVAIAVAESILRRAEDLPARRPEHVARRFGEG